MSVTTRSRRYLTDAARAFERAPAEVTAAVVLAVAWSYAVAEGGMAMRAWTELFVAASLIVAAAWTGTLLHALGAWSAKRRWAVTAAGSVVVALYALLVLDLEYAAEGWRAFMLVGAAALWLAAVPALAAMPAFVSRSRTASGGVDRVSADPTDLTRDVDGRVLLRAIGALLYCGALFAGLALAVAAVDTLFELDLDSEIFAHVFGWIFLVLGPWIVAGGVPEYVRPVHAPAAGGGVAGVAHRMAAYLVPPLLALYCIILYAYAVRIGVTGEVPKNLVSPMVLAAGALVALALFLFDDGADDVRGDPIIGAPDRGLLRWVRYAPALFLPLALLGIWALWMRIDQYGWTEFRLLRVIALIAFAALAVGACVLLVRRRRYPLHLVPLTLAAVLVFAAVGPWSVMAVSERSQYGRLMGQLTAVGIDPAETALPTSQRTVPGETYEQINSISRYLATHHGSSALPPAIEARVGDEWQVFDVAALLGLEAEWPDVDDERGFFGRLAEGEAVSIGDMTMHRVIATPERGGVPTGSVIVRQDSTVLTLAVAGETLYVDIAAFVERARTGAPRRPMRQSGAAAAPSLAAPTNADLTGDDARIDVVDSTGALRGHLLVLNIAIGMEDGVLRLRQLDGLLFLEGGN